VVCYCSLHLHHSLVVRHLGRVEVKTKTFIDLLELKDRPIRPSAVLLDVTPAIYSCLEHTILLLTAGV